MDNSFFISILCLEIKGEYYYRSIMFFHGIIIALVAFSFPRNAWEREGKANNNY